MSEFPTFSQYNFIEECIWRQIGQQFASIMKGIGIFGETWNEFWFDSIFIDSQ